MSRRGWGDDAIYWVADRKRYVGAASLGFGPDGKRLRKVVTGKTFSLLEWWVDLDCLAAGERGAGTEVLSVAESNARASVASDVEAVGIGEYGRAAIGAVRLTSTRGPSNSKPWCRTPQSYSRISTRS